MRNKQLIVLMLSLLLVLNTGCGSESDVQNGVNLRQNQLMGNEIVLHLKTPISQKIGVHPVSLYPSSGILTDFIRLLISLS